MAKYRPESRGKLEKKVKDLDYEAKDRTKHMGKVVKDSKVVANLSKKLRTPATLEAGKAIKQCLLLAGKQTRAEFKRQQKKAEDVVKKGTDIKKDLKQREKASKVNREQLIKAVMGIKETPAARKDLNQAGHVVKKESAVMKALDYMTEGTIRGVRQSIHELSRDLGATQGLGLAINDQGLKATFELSPSEIEGIVEEHQMDIKMKGQIRVDDSTEVQPIDGGEWE